MWHRDDGSAQEQSGSASSSAIPQRGFTNAGLGGSRAVMLRTRHQQKRADRHFRAVHLRHSGDVTVDGATRTNQPSAPFAVRTARNFFLFFVKHYRRPLRRNPWFWGAVILSVFTCGWSCADGNPLGGLVAVGIYVSGVGLGEHVFCSFREGLRS